MQIAINTYNRIILSGGPYEISGTITIPAKTLELLDGGDFAGFAIVGQDSGAVGVEDAWNAFEFHGGNITIDDSLLFYGENDPFDNQYVQNQNSVLNFKTGATFGNVYINAEIRNMYGFAMNGGPRQATSFVVEGTYTECGNGLNISVDGIIYRNITMTDVESIETAARDILIEDFVIVRGSGGISAGGYAAPTKVLDGIIIRNGTIDDTVSHGIIIADMAKDALVQNVDITNTGGNGVQLVATSEGTWIEGTTLDDVTVNGAALDGIRAGGGDVRTTTIDACNVLAASVHGIRITATATDTTINNTYARGGGEVGEYDINNLAGSSELTLTGTNDYETCSGCT